MINRREFLEMTAGAGAALALTPVWLHASLQSSKLMERAIPSSGERLPVISFAPRPPADPAPYKEILKTYLDNGGRVVDVLHGGPPVEQGVHSAANELGIQDKFFWTTPLNIMPAFVPGAPPPKPDPAATKAALEEKIAAFK